MLSFLTPYLLYIKIAGIVALVLFTSWATHKVDMGNIADERIEAANEAISTLEKRAEVKAEHEQRVQNAIEKASQSQTVINDATAFGMSDELRVKYSVVAVKGTDSCKKSKDLYRRAREYSEGLERLFRQLQERVNRTGATCEQINLSAIQSDESE